MLGNCCLLCSNSCLNRRVFACDAQSSSEDRGSSEETVASFSNLSMYTMSLRNKRTQPTRQRNSRSTSSPWSVSQLEQRLMLDGAGLAAAVPDAALDSPAMLGSSAPVARANSAELIFVDASVSDIATIAKGISDSAELVLLDGSENALEQISKELSARRSVRAIHIISHGHQGQLAFESGRVDFNSLQAHRELIAQWKGSLTSDADILLYGCNVAEGNLGQRFIERLSQLSGADVAASINITGANSQNADWILESAVGKIDSQIALSRDAQSKFRHTLASTIQIFAAGTTGDETIELLIGGQSVATYSGLGSGAYSGQYQTFTYNSSADVTADDVRVEFTNDLYDPANNIDRNVAIDAVTIDGVRFETEDASVFSTGTWLPADGVVPGFGRGEFLNTDGYFQYASRDNNGSTIQLRVRGDEGNEQFNLRINGEVVGTYDATTDWQTLTYNHSDFITANDLRVEFINSQYDPSAGVDQNLYVDNVVIDGQTYETEDASVYSTGTWTLADNIIPGFGRGETLNADGYFQYSNAVGNSGSQILMSVRGTEGFERFNLVIDGQVAGEFGVASTDEFSMLAYTHDSAVAPSDVRIEFINDQWDPAAGIDADLVVDYLSIDGKAYQTESPAVYSTGTWTDAGLVPGYQESETLHTTGYFQFADTNYFSTFDAEGDGEWSDVEPLGLIPIHAIVLPDGKVFSFGTTALGMQSGQFIYSIYDPETGVETILPNTTDTDIFCSNMSIDPLTGNVMIFGGDARGEGGPVNGPVNDVLVFDYTDMTIRDATQGEMEYDRWYGSSITLPNGEILVLGGTGGGEDIPEVFNANTGWRTLTGVNMNINYYYPKMWVVSDGSVVVMSNSGSMYRINTSGTGSSQQIGTAGVPHSNTSPGIMYDVDKIAFVGTDAKIYTGDLSAASPTFTAVANVLSARRDAGMSMLPDGRVIITGGGSQFNVLGSAVYATEIWDPTTNQVEVVEDLELARLYHSTHLLLPNGTIWAAGGGAPGPLTNLNGEFYSPDYLYNADGTLADRPVIIDAPSNIGNNATFTITVEDSSQIDRITAVRSGALTHAVNSDNRFVELSFNVVDGTTIEITTPNANIMVPGSWMLFALDTNGTPSEAGMLGVAMANIVDTPHLR